MKKYLGDAVYATFDGVEVVLTTENGIEVTNVIHLEPAVMAMLLNFWRDHCLLPLADKIKNTPPPPQ